MELGLVGQAVGLFAVTNVDDLVLLAVYFGQAAASRTPAAQVVAGQYVGFVGILAIAIAGALGAGLLPESARVYLGLLPLALGLRAARRVWKERHDDRDPDRQERTWADGGPRVDAVAGVTFANSGDNLGVYVPVFAKAGPAGMTVYVVVFLALVGVWCAAGRWFATRQPVALLLARWGHVVLPVVLIAIGLVILVEGGAFGL
jgi:cadmium resistance protein CadD (predicted permease)